MFATRRIMLAAVLATSCRTGPPPPGHPDLAPPAARAAPPPETRAGVVAPVEAPPRVPSFGREIAPYLARTCAAARRCHGDRPTSFVDLDLRAGASYRQLVDVAADERPAWRRVKPRAPDESYVVVKLLGRALGDKEGTAMPRDEHDNRPVSPIPFDPAFLDNALLPWIRAGAPNN